MTCVLIVWTQLWFWSALNIYSWMHSQVRTYMCSQDLNFHHHFQRVVRRDVPLWVRISIICALPWLKTSASFSWSGEKGSFPNGRRVWWEGIVRTSQMCCEWASGRGEKGSFLNGRCESAIGEKGLFLNGNGRREWASGEKGSFLNGRHGCVA